MNTCIQRFCLLAALAATLHSLHAGSATWNQNPTSNDWNTATNWTPETIPSSENDTATFDVSNVIAVVCGQTSDTFAHSIVGDIVFTPDAPAYTITVTPDWDILYVSILEVNGKIINSSGVAQTFVAANSGGTRGSARIDFLGSASAGENVIFTNEGGISADGDGTYGGSTSFYDTSTAANATFINNGSSASDTIFGGFTNLLYYSNAESATFINNPGTVAGAAAGHTLVQTFALGTWGRIGDSKFIANPATVPGAEGGWVEIDVGTSASANFLANGATAGDCQAGQIYVYGGDGYASFNGKGGRGANAQGGLIDLFGLPNSEQTVVRAQGGTNGGLGGTILVEATPVLDLGQFQLFGNGTLDLINATGLIVIGSLSGSGIVSLDSHTLSVGNNNVNTTFSGVIQGSGGLTKAGSGTFTLTGANTYTGNTNARAGALIANNRTGSATGTGNVTINSGTLGGKGIIAGAGTIGMGTGSAAFLAPSVASNQPVTLTLQKALTFRADGTYTCKLNTRNGRADQVIAKGVTIESGAQFDFQAVANKRLANGTVFTVINNSSANAISGVFANLADNSTFTVGRNNYEVSYTGGDGNDLTLTVVP